MRRNIGAVVLAAGLSRRMGEQNKLLVCVGGRPMVRVVAETALSAGFDPVIAVLGHEPKEVRHALEGLPVAYAETVDPHLGLARSLAVGIRELSRAGAAAALVLLGDMPMVSAEHIQALVDAFDPAAGRSICVPVHAGRRGNPVLWDSRYFDEIQALEGDQGAKSLLDAHAEGVWQVPVTDSGVLADVDTPGDVERLLGPSAPAAP